MIYLLLTLLIMVISALYQISALRRQIVVMDFSNRSVQRLLIKKNIISASEIDIATNELIGDMLPDEGENIRESAKKMGITIPEYMEKDDLEIYIRNNEERRATERWSKIKESID